MVRISRSWFILELYSTDEEQIFNTYIPMESNIFKLFDSYENISNHCINDEKFFTSYVDDNIAILLEDTILNKILITDKKCNNVVQDTFIFNTIIDMKE